MSSFTYPNLICYIQKTLNIHEVLYRRVPFKLKWITDLLLFFFYFILFLYFVCNSPESRTKSPLITELTVNAFSVHLVIDFVLWNPLCFAMMEEILCFPELWCVEYSFLYMGRLEDTCSGGQTYSLSHREYFRDTVGKKIFSGPLFFFFWLGLKTLSDLMNRNS